MSSYYNYLDRDRYYLQPREQSWDSSREESGRSSFREDVSRQPLYTQSRQPDERGCNSCYHPGKEEAPSRERDAWRDEKRVVREQFDERVWRHDERNSTASPYRERRIVQYTRGDDRASANSYFSEESPRYEEVNRVEHPLERHYSSPHLREASRIEEVWSDRLPCDVKRRREPVEEQYSNRYVEPKRLRIDHGGRGVADYVQSIQRELSAGYPKRAIELLYEMHKDGIELTADYFAPIFIYYRRQEHVEGYKTLLLETMRDLGVRPEAISFRSLMSLFYQRDDLASALELKREMDALSIVPDATSYNILIGCFVRREDQKSAEALFEEMQRFRITPTQHTYTMMLKLCSTKANVERADELLIDMHYGEVKLSTITYSAMLDLFAKKGDVEGAEYIWKKMKEEKLKPDRYSYTILINLYVKMGMIENAIYQLERMKEKGFVPNQPLLSSLLHLCTKRVDTKSANRVITLMKACGIEPDEITCKCLIELLSKLGNSREAKDLFNTTIGIEKRIIDQFTIDLHGLGHEAALLAFKVFRRFLGDKFETITLITGKGNHSKHQKPYAMRSFIIASIEREYRELTCTIDAKNAGKLFITKRPGSSSV